MNPCNNFEPTDKMGADSVCQNCGCLQFQHPSTAAPVNVQSGDEATEFEKWWNIKSDGFSVACSSWDAANKTKYKIGWEACAATKAATILDLQTKLDEAVKERDEWKKCASEHIDDTVKLTKGFNGQVDELENALTASQNEVAELKEERDEAMNGVKMYESVTQSLRECFKLDPCLPCQTVRFAHEKFISLEQQAAQLRSALETVSAVVPRFTHAFDPKPGENTVWLHYFIQAALDAAQKEQK